MNYSKLLLSAVAVVILNLGHAQVKTITVKKGEAIDLLLINTNKDAKEELNEYYEKVIPIGKKWGYKPQYSSRVPEPPLQGNYWPDVLVIAKWDDYDKRVKFVEDIEKLDPQFHTRRRKIWPTFNLTYWKVLEDKEVTIDPEKFYIATSYWSKDENDFVTFKDDWIREAEILGGKIIMQFTGGISPFGYYYNPELFTITEWNNREDFEKFHKKNQAMDHSGVKHVNQFIIQ